MPIAGVIAERTRGIFPITWDALSSDARYGDDLLQGSIDLVKEMMFGSVISPALEDTYPLRVIDYAAKMTALELVPAGVDYWMNLSVQEVTTGTNESTAYVDRADKLLKLRDILLAETRAEAAEIEAIIGNSTGFRPTRLVSGPPGLSSINDELLTPSPQEFPRPYAATGRS
jgi:hypothetical protein